jgi:HAD superfamily phosphatase (TIGR01681 family)
MSPRTDGSPETSAADLRDRLARVKRLAAEGDSAAARALLWSLASPDDDFVIQARLARVLSLLSSAGLGLKPLRNAILASSTVDHFADVLGFWLAREGFAADLWIAPFDTIVPSALDAAGPLYAFEPDLIWLFTSGRDVRIEVTDDLSAAAAVAAAVRRTQSLWEALRSRRDCTILQNNADIPAVDGLGNFATQAGSSRRNLLRRYNLDLADAAPHGVVLFDLEHLSSLHGKARWNDSRYWYHSKHAFAPDSYGRVAFQAARLISALAGKARKCLVVDLDNTLWGGTIGDDGLAGLQLGNGADGEAFVDFQRWLVGLRERGVILVACSKNEEEIAKEPFLAHPDCVLRLDDFAMFRANWNSKADNIRDIANALNIGLDSLVFVDDSPLERDAVRTHLPEVAARIFRDRRSVGGGQGAHAFLQGERGPRRAPGAGHRHRGVSGRTGHGGRGGGSRCFPPAADGAAHQQEQPVPPDRHALHRGGTREAGDAARTCGALCQAARPDRRQWPCRGDRAGEEPASRASRGYLGHELPGARPDPGGAHLQRYRGDGTPDVVSDGGRPVRARPQEQAGRRSLPAAWVPRDRGAERGNRLVAGGRSGDAGLEDPYRIRKALHGGRSVIDPGIVRGRLNQVFREVFDEDDLEIFDAMSAADLEEWDSLSHITLVLAVEKEFRVRLNAAEVGKLDNVGQMIDLLAHRATA